MGGRVVARLMLLGIAILAVMVVAMEAEATKGPRGENRPAYYGDSAFNCLLEPSRAISTSDAAKAGRIRLTHN